jgi:hypothetical protein
MAGRFAEATISECLEYLERVHSPESLTATQVVRRLRELTQGSQAQQTMKTDYANGDWEDQHGHKGSSSNGN